jgi:hypothetical protein
MFPPIRLPALIEPEVDETEDEQSVRVEDGVPPPPPALDVAAAAPVFGAAVLPPDDDPPDDCADCVVPPLT